MSLLVKISLKFGLLLGLITATFGLISSFLFNPDRLSNFGGALSGVLTWLLLMFCLVLAHYELHKKNENYLSFKNAVLSGLIILSISYIISTFFSLIIYEFILKEKMQSVYSNFSKQYGAEIAGDLFTTKALVISSLTGFAFQIVILFIIITAESHWKIFKKAGQSGWASIIPIYNLIVLLEIVKKPTWWFVLLLIPFVNIIFAIWITNLLSKKFNKDEGFTIGLLLLPFIFYPLLGLSKAEYINENHYDIEFNNDLK